MAKRRNFSAAFKAKIAIEALRGDQTLAEPVTRHKVHRLRYEEFNVQALDMLAEFGQPHLSQKNVVLFRIAD